MTRRTSRIKEETVSRIIWSNVRKEQYLKGLTNDDLAMIFECVPRTIVTYDKEPEKVTLKALQKFCEALNIDIAALVTR